MRSISNTLKYRKICSEAYENEEIFSGFKRHPDYTEVLEHVNQIQGELYLNYIKQNSREIFDRIPDFKCNDSYGGGMKFDYSGIGEISPTTLRYIKVLCDIKDKIGDLKGKRVVEIGSGYGGQCLILKKFFGEIDYSILDIEEASSLSAKYLEKNGQNVNIIDISNLNSFKGNYDLVISNYAYSELDKELQDLYYESMIENAKSGYLTFNFVSDFWGIDSYSEKEILMKFSKKNIQVLDEFPKTFENNIILFWNEKS